jgi:hypothetical protein
MKAWILIPASSVLSGRASRFETAFAAGTAVGLSISTHQLSKILIVSELDICFPMAH